MLQLCVGTFGALYLSKLASLEDFTKSAVHFTLLLPCMWALVAEISSWRCRNVVMVPDSHMDPSTTQQADEVLDSLQDFDPTHWGLPAFTD